MKYLLLLSMLFCFSVSTMALDEDEPITVAQFKEILGPKGSAEDLDELMMRIDNGGGDVVWDKAEAKFYVALLKSTKPSHQFAGIYALTRVKDATHVAEVIRFLETKPFRKLVKAALKEEIKPDQYRYHMFAAAFSVVYLGNAGDKRAIPVLRSIQKFKDIRVGTHSPVPGALAKLSSPKQLLPETKSHANIDRAAESIAKIKDPGRLSELESLIFRKDLDIRIRMAAVSAVREIGTRKGASILIETASAKKVPTELRRLAIHAAAVSKEVELVEKGLLRITGHSKLGTDASTALCKLNPTKYLSETFKFILDPKGSSKERRSVLLLLRSVNLAKSSSSAEHKGQLIKCLEATAQKKPADGIRLEAWRLLVMNFQEFHKVELADPAISKSVDSYLQKKVMLANPHLSVAEESKAVEELRKKFFVKANQDKGNTQ